MKKWLFASAFVLAVVGLAWAQGAPRLFMQQVEVHRGDLVLGTSVDIVMEGATVDAFDATITPTDPTADYTVTLGGASHTTGDIAVVYAQGPAVADAVDTIFFIADRDYTVTDIDVVWAVAETTGAMDVMIERLQGTEAMGSGDDLLAAVVDATGTANTVANGTLTATTANLDLSAGDRLAVELTATPNEVTNIVATVALEIN